MVSFVSIPAAIWRNKTRQRGLTPYSATVDQRKSLLCLQPVPWVTSGLETKNFTVEQTGTRKVYTTIGKERTLKQPQRCHTTQGVEQHLKLWARSQFSVWAWSDAAVEIVVTVSALLLCIWYWRFYAQRLTCVSSDVYCLTTFCRSLWPVKLIFMPAQKISPILRRNYRIRIISNLAGRRLLNDS